MDLRVTLQLFPQNQKVNQPKKTCLFFQEKHTDSSKKRGVAKLTKSKNSINTLTIFYLQTKLHFIASTSQISISTNNQHFS